MSERSVRLRAAAATDIDAATDYCLAEAGGDVALRFVDAVERVLGQIARSPKAGSLRFSYELDIPDLRARPLTRFPYLVFYVIAEERIEVWRVSPRPARRCIGDRHRRCSLAREGPGDGVGAACMVSGRPINR